MKKLLNILLAASLIVALASCGDEEEPAVELKLATNSVTMEEGQTVEVKIETGNGGYDPKSEAPATATADLKDATTVSITGVKAGSTSVTVTDARKKTATISVTVTAAEEIPTSPTFAWNGTPAEFDKAGASGITILSNSVALTNLASDAKRQYLLSWTGSLTEGEEKTTGITLKIAEPGEDVVTIPLTSLKVLQANASGNYLTFGDGSKSGKLFFTN